MTQDVNNNGWIKLHRKLLDNGLWRERREFSKAEAWIDILLNAQHSHEPQEVWLKNTMHWCYRGQCLKSLDTWARRWGWTKSKVRRVLDMFQKANMIRTESDTQTTRLTVCNYDYYNGERNANETQMKRKRNANETQTTPDKNVENVENVKNEKKEEDIFPSGSRQKPEAAKKRIKVNCNTETMKRIGRWFNRQESTLWSVYEAVALEQVAPGEAQIKGMEQFYTADLPPDNDYRRRSVETLLNNWHTELDKAREYARKNKPQQQETIL